MDLSQIGNPRPFAQIDHRAADEPERELGADADHFAENVDRGERRDDRDDRQPCG
jgi:hypothetical protein